uniref:Nucleotide-diphospho-sugar transferase domain-containing protein n=1 Tax=Emiliania huxleyi (strain CCMP1516) TaxID=280463 RepID=A0A0D3IKE5_EMIH1
MAGGDTKPLDLIAPADGPWPVNCAELPELCEVVKKVAVGRAVMAAVSNSNILQMLGQFVDVVQKVGVPNFLVVALDERTKQFLDGRGCPSYRRSLRARGGGTDNHATSSLKFQILAEMLSVGVSVLLSDVDIVITKDLLGLRRETRRERCASSRLVRGMTDGWDDRTAYGHVLPTAMPGSKEPPLASLRLVARNSGLFYLGRHATLAPGWASPASLHARSQSRGRPREARPDAPRLACAQEIFRLAYGSHEVAGVTVRTMNYMCFLNTKFLFKHMRSDAALADRSRHVPVSCHVNYHPEKEARMVSIKAFYHGGDDAALKPWNGGEGRNTGGCSGKVGVNTDRMPPLGDKGYKDFKLGDSLLAANEEWSWSGEGGGVHFRAGGALSSPWGEGTWGPVPSPWRKDSVYVALGGQTYLLMFLSEKWAFTAVRCSDEEVSFGQLKRRDTPQRRLVW